MKDTGRFDGIIFRRHAFSERSLTDRMEKIRSFVAKIRTDIENWALRKRLSDKIKMFYNENARELRDRLDEIRAAVEQRQPTLWERVCGFFNTLYKFVVEKLLPVITFRFIPGRRRFSEIGEDM